MSIFRRRPALRWLVPALVALLLAVAGSVVGVVTAVARDGLPQRSASRLLVDVQRARVDGLSGTIVQDAELGLPDLSALGGGGSSDLTSLVSGSHTLRLWYDGPDRVRLALLGTLGESDVVRRGADLWTWSSSTKSATHRSLPARTADAPHSLGEASPFTPQQAADAALRAISPSTWVRTDGTAVVAGRDAYELVLRPRQHASLVGSVRIAIDGDTHVPTRVQVYARGADRPAFEVGFTSFDPSRPDASVFRFNPPRGTKVTESTGPIGPGGLTGLTRPTGPRHALRAPGAGSSTRGSRPDAAPRVVGRGWTSVVVASVPPGASGASGPLASMLRVLPRVHGSWGSGRLLGGTLFSAVLTDDGRLAVGAVAPEALYAALGR